MRRLLTALFFAAAVAGFAGSAAAQEASAMFHVSISGQIPPVGYLTFADKFMVLTYLILLMSFCLSLAVYLMQGKPGKQASALKLHHFTEGMVFAEMPALYIAMFLFVR